MFALVLPFAFVLVVGVILIPVVATLVAAVGGGIYLWLTRKKATGPGIDKPNPNDPELPAPVEPGKDPAAVAALLGTYAHGRFHKPQQGDSISGLVDKALKRLTNPTIAQRKALRSALNRSRYNREVYGEPVAGDDYAYEGLAVNRAFLPKHQNAVAKLSIGWIPYRQIDGAGHRTGPETSWGALWVPLLNEAAIKAGIADPAIMIGTHADGSSGIEPPPSFWENVQGLK